MRRQQVQQILDVAGDLFFERGFQNARVSDIAARSEISTASIYKAFGSKDALFRAALARGIDRLKLLATPLLPDDDPIAGLLHATHRYQEICVSPLFRDLIRAPIEHNSLPLTLRRSVGRQIRSALEKLCIPPLQACAEVGLLDLRQINEAFQLLSAYIEHKAVWNDLLTSPPSQGAIARAHITNEAVRITFLAYPPTQAEASDPSASAPQSVVATRLGSHRAPKD